jgi:hypothetical protein
MSVPDVVANVAIALEEIKGFLNSAFISAFLSALAGAGLGVWGAQGLAERSMRRRELIDALRQANALIVLSATISNQALVVKKQHILPLSTTYFEERVAAETTNEILLSGGIPESSVRFSAQMVHITPLTVPVEALKNLIYSAQLMPGRALALVAMVEQSLTELSHAISLRSEQIERFKNHSMPMELFVQNYFGLKRRDGNIDSLYHDSMIAVTQYTDDVAFFGAELADELQSHAVRVREKLLKLSKEVPKANTVDFSGPRKSGLMPSRENYESWLSGFKSQD